MPLELQPIKILSPEDRVSAFEKASNSIYTKFSPYANSERGLLIGVRQPFVWTSITDSNLAKNLTKYDTQAVPIGSTIRDLERVGKFMASDAGLLFIGKQYLLQQQTAFNETRVYNPLSVLAATAAKGSTGLIERPVRFLPTDGSRGDMVSSAILSVVGLQSDSINSKPKGTAQSESAISVAAGIAGGANKGLVRFEGGYRAYNNFKEKWVDAGASKGIGFAEGLKNTLLNKFKSFFPSTKPFLNGSDGTQVKWDFRPEYPEESGGTGAFESMRADAGQLLSFRRLGFNPHTAATTGKGSQSAGIFKTVTAALSNKYFGAKSSTPARAQVFGVANAIEIHKYFPPSKDGSSTEDGKKYVKSAGDLTTAFYENTDEFSAIATNFAAMEGKSYYVAPQRRAAEVSAEVFAGGVNYVKQLGAKGDAPTTFTKKLQDGLTLDKRGFAKASSFMKGIGTADEINLMLPFVGERMDGSGDAPSAMRMPTDYYNSKDIIYFYFYDLVNSMYVPFRATINGLNDLHSPDWDEVSYLGRADKLYIYKGFTREVNFSFTVYANSLRELVPMWKRINYLVGLSRPSKYTTGNATSNQFMYPPMITFRLGDMYVDQPCVLKSIGVNIPDDSLWESQRGRGQDYSLLKGVGVDFSKYSSDKMYQLPTKVDITINMSLMEKKRSEVSADHFFTTDDGRRDSGNDTPYKSTSSLLNADPVNLGSTSFGAPDPSDANKIPSFDSVKISSSPLTLQGQSDVTARQFSDNNMKGPLTLSSQTSFAVTPEEQAATDFSLLTPRG